MDLDPILFECSSCSAELVRQEFSKSQLKRHPHSPRCRECVAAEEETAAACAGREPSSDDDGGGSHDDHHHLSAHSDHWSTEEEDEESRDDEDDSTSGVSDPMLKEAPEGLPSPRGGHAKWQEWRAAATALAARQHQLSELARAAGDGDGDAPLPSAEVVAHNVEFERGARRTAKLGRKMAMLEKARSSARWRLSEVVLTVTNKALARYWTAWLRAPHSPVRRVWLEIKPRMLKTPDRVQVVGDVISALESLPLLAALHITWPYGDQSPHLCQSVSALVSKCQCLTRLSVMSMPEMDASRMFGASRHLVRVKLELRHISLVAFGALASSLASLPSLERVTLVDIDGTPPLRGDSSQAALLFTCTIRRLRLCGSFFSKRMFAACVSGRGGRLNHLDLHDGASSAVWPLLERLPELQTVRMYNCRFSSSRHAALLAAALACSTTLRTLEIFDTNIKDRGAIGNALVANTSLRRLCISERASRGRPSLFAFKACATGGSVRELLINVDGMDVSVDVASIMARNALRVLRLQEST